MDANKIQVTDEEGNELEFDVLFTFDSEDTGKKYVLYYDAEVEAPQVYSSIYDDEGRLFPIETPEEWDMIEEVFNSFISQDDEEDEEEEAECEHNGCCHDGDENHECCQDSEEHDEHVCCCHKNEG